jgi:hypothetical protein
MLTAAKWKILERQIIRRDHGACQAVCGCTTNLTVHHIVPRAEDGSDDPQNLVTLCKLCHDEIEDTDIRTMARIRLYIPRWHETASWYDTTPQRRTLTTKAARKPKLPPKMSKPRGIHLRLDTKHMPDTESIEKPKRAPQLAPLAREDIPAPMPSKRRQKPYGGPAIEELDVFWVRREIISALLDYDEDFDPIEINQTPEAWNLLTHWWLTGEDIPLSSQETVGIWDSSPIYDDFDGEYFRPRISDDPEEAIPYLRFLIEQAEAELNRLGT